MKHHYLICLFLALLFSTACTTVPKLLDQRKFAEAYALSYKLCTRGRAPNERRLSHYLNAYEAVQAAELFAAKRLASTPGTAKYAELYEHYADLHERSLDILEVLPDAANFERYPALAPATLESQREDARKRAGHHFLAKIDTLRPAALAGEKPAARAAWHLHQRVTYFLPGRDAEFTEERNHLRDIGTLRILIFAPQGEGDRELDNGLASIKPFHHDWTSVLTQANGLRIDLEAELLFDRYVDDGLDESCSTSVHKEEVLDYIEKKKVKKRINDSTVVEEIIEIEHYKNVYAEVTECTQTAGVRVFGRVNVYAAGYSEVAWSTLIGASDDWGNTYRRGYGDHRAMPAFANSGNPSSPPSLGRMLDQATTRLAGAGHGKVVQRYAPGSKRKKRKVSWLF